MLEALFKYCKNNYDVYSGVVNALEDKATMNFIPLRNINTAY